MGKVRLDYIYKDLKYSLKSPRTGRWIVIEDLPTVSYLNAYRDRDSIMYVGVLGENFETGEIELDMVDIQNRINKKWINMTVKNLSIEEMICFLLDTYQ